MGQSSGITKKIKEEKFFGIGSKDQEVATTSSGPGVHKVREKLPPLWRDAQASTFRGKSKVSDLEGEVHILKRGQPYKVYKAFC